MKLEHRLALLAAGVTAGTIATCLTMAFLLVRHAAERELDEEVVDGANAAAVVVAQLEESMESRGETPLALEIPAEVALVVQRIAVYSKTGQRVATRPEAIEVPNQLSELVTKTHGEVGHPFNLQLPEGPMRAVLVSSKLLHGMTVLHAVSRTPLDEEVQSRGRLFLGLFLGTLSLVILSARWLGRRLASDVNRITAVARRVASGELTARAGTSGLASPETRNLAKELDHMIGELAALMASQRNFISYAAHELRSPLATIQGELQLALRHRRTEDRYVETLSAVLTDVGELTQLAEDLLTLARAQAGGTSVDHARVEGFVEDALRLVQGAAQIQEVTIEVQLGAAQDVLVNGRRSDLTRLLRNLLENAIKFGNQGGHVRVIAHRDETSVELAVEDDGPGIALKEQANLFDPFYRGSNIATAQISGTGLGLAISREIARKFGGDIQVDPEIRAGTRMVVRLSLVEISPTSSSLVDD